VIEERTITSVAEFSTIVGEKSSGAMLWYRGVKNSSHALVPSLYRHEGSSTPAQFAQLERKVMTSFQHRSPPFLKSGPPADHFERLFLMQHFGVPTRLLDWTENPFMALFFALDGMRGTKPQTMDAAVWFLNPVTLNRLSLPSHEHAEILSVGDDLLNGYEPLKPAAKAKNPVALYGVHNSQRIVAQRGVFVLFGTNTQPLNEITWTENSGGLLMRVLIPVSKGPDIFKQLFGMGMTDSVLFPDLEGLAREIKTWHGF
jgi:hypothetical protein